MSIIFNLNKHKWKEIITGELANKEKEFLIQQLALVESQVQAKKTHLDTMEKQKLDLGASIKYTNKVSLEISFSV